MRYVTILLFTIMPVLAQGSARDSSLITVMDRFIATYSADNLAWRTDVQMGGVDPEGNPPEGYMVGQSEEMGPFIYRPVRADSLDAEQRRAVMRDPRFAPYLAQMRQIADEGPATLPASALAAAAQEPEPQQVTQPLGRAEMMAKLLAGRRPPPITKRFQIPAEELILPGAVVITSE